MGCVVSLFNKTLEDCLYQGSDQKWCLDLDVGTREPAEWSRLGRILHTRQIKSIRITNRTSVATVPSHFLAVCASLESVDCASLVTVTRIEGFFLHKCASLVRVDNMLGLKNVEFIGAWCFGGCKKLESLDTTYFRKVTSVDYCFMRDCTRLRQLDAAGFPKVETIGNSFLRDCSSLVSLDTSGFISLTEVGNNFLQGCSSLKNFEISGLRRVSKVGANFCAGCNKLKSVHLQPGMPRSIMLNFKRMQLYLL
jgi:hypothetical protein